jgi:two-component system phosphate regulon response regulator OmpR
MSALLIVEDDTQLREKMAAILTEAFPSVQIFQAADASDASRIVDKERPDAAIVDIKLPGTSGLELTRSIKLSYSKTIVIINSNYDSVEYRSAATQHGADYFLSKKENPLKDLIELTGSIIGTPAGRAADTPVTGNNESRKGDE